MFDPKFFLATVTSNEDPDLRGRVRIRIMGIHTEITTKNENMLLGMEEKDLPLAQCLYPVTYTGTGGTCPPPSLQPGDWVLGISLDGDSYQNLMVLGLAKAKFNAEALADGSINANDAFANVQSPIAPTRAEENAAKAEVAAQKHAAAKQESELQKYNKVFAPQYEAAAQIASSWTPSTAGSGTNYTSYGVSTGTALVNILSYINDTSMMENFKKTSRLNINPNIKSDSAKNIIEEGYYTYCWKYFNQDTDKTSPVLPSFAFKFGCGEVDNLLSSYGDPRSGSISYAQFYNNMKNDGFTEEASYFKEVVAALNKNKTSNVTLQDKTLEKFLNHQYVLSSKIASKTLRVLGDVVFPTIRSTVLQTQQMLPYYNIEGNSPHEHIGVDLATSAVPVVAFAEGIVTSAKTTDAKDCNAVVILHNAGIKTLYMHMNDVLVKTGDKVKAGQKIGTGGGAGANGPNTHHIHLHFTVKKENKIIDPLKFFRNEIGFAVNELSTVNYYRKGPLAKTEQIYKDLLKKRGIENIPWGF